MLSPETQWKLAQLKQAELLREAQQNQRLEQAQEGKTHSLWQGLAQSLGDRMIAAGERLKAAAKPAPGQPTKPAPGQATKPAQGQPTKPAPSPAAPECGA